MGAPVPDVNPAEGASAEALLNSLRTISAGERRKHASVFNYWLSIRQNREFPPIRDLDPLEISDAGPFSLLLEMIGGGEDAEVRHLGQAIKGGIEVDKIGEAPDPSLLACIAKRLPVVAALREAFAFEDQFEGENGKTRCWVTLLPFSATGTWIDFVYGFVSLDPQGDGVMASPEDAEEASPADETPEIEAEPAEIAEPVAAEAEPVEEVAGADETELASEAPMPTPVAAASSGKAGFSAKFFESLAAVGGFYGKPVEVELDPDTAKFETGNLDEALSEDDANGALTTEEPVEPVAEQAGEPISTSEGTLQSKLEQVRSKADEARQAKLRANAALYEGLSAAYDFALDAEDTPEDYLRLVEAQGLKIQLRSPMKPVAKLAFDGMCDEATIKQLEAILAWAFDEELPRGTLAERIEAEGGITPILNKRSQAA